MVSSVISRLNDRRDAAADLGEDAGFTLIELMVVLLILAILLAIAIPTFLGVTGGANDRSAQSNLNTALTAVKTQATQLGQSYTGITTTLMSTAEPSISWATGTQTSGTVSTQGPVSFYVSTDGNGIVLASFSKSTGNCWYAVDNLSTVTTTSNGPYVTAGNGTAGSVPTTAGTWYGEVKGAASCNASGVPTFQAGWAANYTGIS